MTRANGPGLGAANGEGQGGVHLEAQGLHVERDGKAILRDIQLAFRPGELVALLGPSGSGKSTLLKALMGLVPSRGRLAIHPPEAKAIIGYVPQDDVLHPSLSVDKALAYSAALRLVTLDDDARAGAVTRVIAEVGLQDHRRTRISRLSGGQRKRVSVALELLGRPKLFFLDEPTSGLDPALEAQLMELLRRITGPDRLTVVTTHVMASLDRVDLAVILAQGRLVYVGPPKDAPEFFEVGGLAEIYQRLAKDGASRWADRLSASALLRTWVSARLYERSSVPTPKGGT